MFSLSSRFQVIRGVGCPEALQTRVTFSPSSWTKVSEASLTLNTHFLGDNILAGLEIVDIWRDIHVQAAILLLHLLRVDLEGKDILPLQANNNTELTHVATSVRFHH